MPRPFFLLMRVSLIILFCILNTPLFSQNLVYNGSMEEYYQCPNTGGQLNFAKGWFGYDGQAGSCEYFNSCSINMNSYVGVPKNTFGFQYPRTGNAYHGFAVFSMLVVAREFSMTSLKIRLKANTNYHISFYASLANPMDYAIKELGIYCSKDTITFDQLFADTINPSFINTDSIIMDTLNWVKISGIFKARGGERYLTLGNFYINRPFIYKKVNNKNNDFSYYYIDDVALYPITAPIVTAQCAHDTLICKGNTIAVGKTRIEEQYKAEYKHLWYIAGREQDTLSTEQFPVFAPDSSTTYVLKLTDFKYDVTYDTIRVSVVDCAMPTSLKVYPNPTNDIVFFDFDSPIPNDLNIELFNILGQKIESLDYLQDYQHNTVQLNLSTHATGLYFYRVVVSGKQMFEGKIIKQ